MGCQHAYEMVRNWHTYEGPGMDDGVDGHGPHFVRRLRAVDRRSRLLLGLTLDWDRDYL